MSFQLQTHSHYKQITGKACPHADLMSISVAIVAELLLSNQWGFTEGKYTTTALLSFTHECQEALDNRGEVCLVFFDLCKAFDSVPDKPLLHKLFHLQVNPFLRWMQSYLSSRTQAVVLGCVITILKY